MVSKASISQNELAFEFVSDATKREFKALPPMLQIRFGRALDRIQKGKNPELPLKALKGKHWSGVIELIEQGDRQGASYRCVYCAKFNDTLYVLHSFQKTTNGPDRHAMKIVEERYKLIPR